MILDDLSSDILILRGQRKQTLVNNTIELFTICQNANFIRVY